ncbi:hypothetical protein U9M48_007320, partial [Paspalum notatum var. saurae]
MAEEIAALECTGTYLGILIPSHLLLLLSRARGSTRLRLTLMVPLSAIRRDLLHEYGCDYDTFAHVAYRTTIHTLVAIASVRRWAITQLDVKMPFFMVSCMRRSTCIPLLVTLFLMVMCLLCRSLNGLKQTPRAWFERFTSVVTRWHDPTLFVHTSPRGHTLILLYVDDMLITGDDLEYIAFVKACLNEQFHMSDLGSLNYFLGIEVSSIPDGYYLSQRKYIQDILDRVRLTVDTPMDLHLRLRATNGVPLEDPTRYRHLVGNLVYHGITRPDISYAIHILSQFMSAPTSNHYGHLRILRYLRGTIDRCLFFSSSNSLQLYAYFDATWGTDPSDFKPISAYCVFLGSSLISWKTKKQIVVARSSVEARLRALACVTAEVTWLRWLLADFGVAIPSSTHVHCDSAGAISIAQDPVKHQLTKHIGIDCFYIQSAVQDHVVSLQYVPSELQLADLLTKAHTIVNRAIFGGHNSKTIGQQPGLVLPHGCTCACEAAARKHARLDPRVTMDHRVCKELCQDRVFEAATAIPDRNQK